MPSQGAPQHIWLLPTCKCQPVCPGLLVHPRHVGFLVSRASARRGCCLLTFDLMGPKTPSADSFTLLDGNAEVGHTAGRCVAPLRPLDHHAQQSVVQ
jgi:hypothetical protein